MQNLAADLVGVAFGVFAVAEVTRRVKNAWDKRHHNVAASNAVTEAFRTPESDQRLAGLAKRADALRQTSRPT